ncbi:MAG: tetratricopeptide repeat protein [Chloroflexi bacterium]|nr:tetratricopeptide repeat protein [Chloroflexota bacterium]
MYLTGKQPTFRRQRPHSSPYNTLILLGILIVSLFILQAVNTKAITSPFDPTPVPTRPATSYTLEGETNFKAGNLNASIAAYQEAARLDPNNALILAELARIQTYSSALLTTDAERKVRLQEALESIDAAVKITPDDSTVHAIRAFVLDWNANTTLAGDKSVEYLSEAAQEAARAYVLDNQNALALAYNAEILVDQQNWVQAEQYVRQAFQINSTLMDVHRVDGYVKESLGYYGDAIDSYKAAIEVTPNLTFLYIYVGYNYRQLKQYDLALEYFVKAVNIDKQLNVEDPVPYMAISKTYSQMGEFFIAARNLETALAMDPSNADVYGSLGIVYLKSRNYESAIPALQCAVRGCDAKTSCIARGECADDVADEDVDPKIEIEGLPLSPTTVVYYYSYGSVLAGMHRPINNYCIEGKKVLQEVRDGFSEDPVIMQIIEPSEEICNTAEYGPES